MPTHVRLVDETSTERMERLNSEAEALIADVMRLRSRLRNAANLPIPDQETDTLIAAIGAFVRASAR